MCVLQAKFATLVCSQWSVPLDFPAPRPRNFQRGFQSGWSDDIIWVEQDVLEVSIREAGNLRQLLPFFVRQYHRATALLARPWGERERERESKLHQVAAKNNAKSMKLLQNAANTTVVGNSSNL